MSSPSSATENVPLYLRQVGRDLVLGPRRPPSAVRGASAKRVLVIGGGVTGLTSAWALLDAGFQVVVVSEQWAPATPRITSQIAGALWEWPPAVCGAHTDSVSLAKSKQWCMTSYRVLSKLAASLPASAHGVRMRLVNFFFRYAIDTDPAALHKMREIAAAGIDAFRRDARLVAEHAVNQRAGIVDSYQHLAPVIDTDAYMVWLQTLVAGRGAVLETRRVSGELLGMEEALLRAYGACAIVNATGLGAKELAGDPTVFPLRGALIRVKNDGKRFPRVTQALCVTHDETRPGEDTIVFVVPRNDDVLILGGVAQRDEWNLDLTLDSPEMKRIRKRCNDFVPGLENAELDPEAPIVQGLRPLTTQNVRVAREPRLVRRDGRLVKSKIVHSYGHGGSGFTLSFGCAADVLGHVRQIVREEQLPGVEEIGIVMARL